MKVIYRQSLRDTGWFGFENQHEFGVKHGNLSMDTAPIVIFNIDNLFLNIEQFV